MSTPVFIGIDVAQARLDIAIRPGSSFSRAHDESAIVMLVEQLRALRPTLIVLEATGGMEIPLTSALATAGLPVVVVNPRQVRDFAKASGPRPMPSMPRRWRSLRRSCGLSHDRCPMNKPER